MFSYVYGCTQAIWSDFAIRLSYFHKIWFYTSSSLPISQKRQTSVIYNNEFWKQLLHTDLTHEETERDKLSSMTCMLKWHNWENIIKCHFIFLSHSLFKICAVGQIFFVLLLGENFEDPMTLLSFLGSSLSLIKQSSFDIRKPSSKLDWKNEIFSVLLVQEDFR